MELTNKGLVEYAKKCLDLGNHSIYVYGTFGQKLTNTLIKQKAEQYLNQNKKRVLLYQNALKKYGNVYAFDCVGLIKSYLWGGYGKVKYNSKQDVSANGMVQVAKVKGKIATLPERPGVLVQMNGHIGIYIGNKEVIECTPNKTYAKQAHKAGGVCKTKLSNRKWTNWCECPFIKYEEEKKEEPKKPESKDEYYPKCTSKYTSIVEALKSVKVDSSFSNRKKIAKKNNIKLYIGTAKQNTKMLELLKIGKLKKI